MVMDLFGQNLGDFMSGDDENGDDDDFMAIDADDDFWLEWGEIDWDEEDGEHGDYHDMDEEDDDWFGSLVNDECAPDCVVEDCEYGQFCILTTCVDPCTGEETCVQDVTFDWEEWE